MAGMAGYRRSVDDSNTVISHAKLEEGELKSVTQVLYFKESGTMTDFKLLELNPKMLKTLQEGQSLIFRGDDDEEAVICTEDATYEVKEAETSNSLLLFSNLKFSDDIPCKHVDRELRENEVLGVFHQYYELRSCIPRVRKLLDILAASRYRGPEHEADVLGSADILKYTRNDLLRVIQASEEELDVALNEFLVIEIGEHLRLLDHEYLFRTTSLILGLIESNSWPLDGIDRAETLKELAPLANTQILEQLFDWLTVPTEDPSLYQLAEDRVCRLLAEAMLRAAQRFNLADFTAAWQQSVPEGMKTDLRQLAGLALTDRTARPAVIWHFPETALPENPTERMRTLFIARDKWTLEDIAPYVRRLAPDVEAFLTRHARASTLNGKRVYSARHGK